MAKVIRNTTASFNTLVANGYKVLTDVNHIATILTTVYCVNPVEAATYADEYLFLAILTDDTTDLYCQHPSTWSPLGSDTYTDVGTMGW